MYIYIYIYIFPWGWTSLGLPTMVPKLWFRRCRNSGTSTLDRNFDLSRQWPPNLLNRVAMMYSTTYLDSVHVPLPCTMVNMVAMVAMDWTALTFSIQLSLGWCLVKDTPSKWLDLALDSNRATRGMVSRKLGVDRGGWWIFQVETKETLAAWSKRPFIQVIEAWPLLESRLHWMRAGRDVVGKYVVRLDGDDCAHPQRLKKQIGFLENHPSIAVLGGGFCTFEDGDPRSLPASSLKRYRMPCHPILTRWRMIFSCSLAHPSVIFRRSVFDNWNSGPNIRKEGKQKIIGAWLVVFLLVFPSSNGMIRYLVT